MASNCTGQNGIIEIVEYSQYSEDTTSPYIYTIGFTLLYQDSALSEKYDRKTGIIYFNHLLPGRYTLRYKSIFQQVFTQEFTHNGQSVQRRNVCYDEFQESPAQFTQLEHLKRGDTLVIQYEGWGCQPYDGGVLTFIKRKHHLAVSFLRSGKVWSSPSVTPVQLRAAITLERQLRSLGCAGLWASTQQDNYSIRLNGAEAFSLLYAEDWNGMERFRSFVFGP